MARPGRPALDERSVGRDRLEAMGLHPGPSDRAQGWIPGHRVEPPRLDVEVAEPPATQHRGIEEIALDWLRDRLPLATHDVLDRLGLGRALAAVALLIIAGVVLVSMHHHSGSGRAGSTYPSTSRLSSGSTPGPDPYASALPSSVADPVSIVVDVGGRVRKPGLVTLPQGARVADAIAAAGGPLRHRELARIDLAARVTDGQLLLVGVKDPTASGVAAPGGSSDSPPAPLDLDSATIDQLETLPGVGPVTAQKILDWRTAHGGFTSVDQLQQVPGIGPARYAELSPLVAP
jgi:competence protein ComEA